MSHPVMGTGREKQNKVSLASLQHLKETKIIFSIPQENVTDKKMQKMEGPKVASGRDFRGF